MRRKKFLRLVSACGLSVTLAMGTTVAWADLASDAKYSVQINGSNFKSENFGIPSAYNVDDFISSKYVYEDFNNWSTNRAGNVSSDGYDPETSTKGGILAEVDSRVKTNINKLGDYTSMTEGQVLPNLMSVKAAKYNDQVQVGWFGSADDGYYGFKGNNVNGVKNPIESAPNYYLSGSLIGASNAADESKKMPYYSTLDNYLNVGDWDSFGGTIVVSYDYLVTLSRGYASGGQVMLRNYGIDRSSGAVKSTFLTGLPAVWYDTGYSSVRTTAHGGISVSDGAASAKVSDQGKINLSGANSELSNVAQGDWVHVTVAITRDASTGKLTQREYINGLPITDASGNAELVIDAKKVTDSYDILDKTTLNYCGIGLNIETSYTDGKWGGIDNICYKVYYGSELAETSVPASRLTGKGETRSVSVPFEAKLNLTEDEKAVAPSGATEGYVDLSNATVSVKKCDADDVLMMGTPVSGAEIDYTTKSDRAMTCWGTDGTNVVTPTQKKGYDGSFIRVGGLPVLASGENLVVTYENGVDMLGNTSSGSFVVYSGNEPVSFTNSKFYNYFGDDVAAELKNGKYCVSSDATKLVIDSGVSDKTITLKDGSRAIATAVYDSADEQYVLSLDAGKTLEKNKDYELWVDGVKKTVISTGDGSLAYRGDASATKPKVDYLNTTEDSQSAVICLVDNANGTNLTAQDAVFSAGTVGTVEISGSITATSKNVLVLTIPDEDDVSKDAKALSVSAFDTANKTEVKGSLGSAMANKDVEIFAFAGGFDTDYASKLKWAARVTADENGDYKVTADFSSLSTADFDFVMTDGVNTYLASKSYGNYNDTQSAIALLNGATDVDSLLQVIKDKRNELEFDYELFDKYPVNQTKTAQYMYDYISAEKTAGRVGLVTTDKATAVKLFRQFAIMSAFSNSTVSDIEKIDDDILDIEKPLIDKWYNDTDGVIGETRLVSWHTSVKNALNGASFTDIADFNKKFEVSLVFAVIKNPETSDSLKSFLTDFSGSDYMNISTDLITTKAVKTISGKSYTGYTYQPVTDDLKANAETNKYPGGGGGGGGGGGSYATVVTDKETPSDDEEPTTPDENKKVYLFDDMGDAEWAADAVETLAKKGIISGKGDGTFEPNGMITREEFAKLTVELASIEVEHGDFPFADVSEDDWCYRYVKAAYKNGIVNGISDDCFGVGMNITRQDLSVMLVNAMKLRNVKMSEAEVSFTDAEEISDYAKSAVAVLTQCGAIGGYEDGSFRPNDNATRAEAAKIIYAVLNMFE